MNALILAAGPGPRLASPAGDAWPLTEIAGRSLVEWSLWQAARVGVRRAVVVTGAGAGAAAIAARLPGIAARTGVVIAPCRLAPEHAADSGAAVLAGAERIAGNYLLLLADHLFEASLLARLAVGIGRAGGALLAIDRDGAGPAGESEAATAVATRHDGSVAAIGRRLVAFDAAGCGALVGTPDLAAAIRAAKAGGAAGSLIDGVQRLAMHRSAATVDVTGHWWIAVEDPARLARARRLAPVFLDGALPAPAPARVRAELRRAVA